MRPTLNHLKHNPTIQTCLALKWPLLGMPLIGYGIAYAQGAMVAGAILVGMIAAVAGFYVFAQIRWFIFKRSQRRLRSICPSCKNFLEGRKICGQCKKELYPYHYVKGIIVLKYCHSCGTKMMPGNIVDQCFNKSCKGHQQLHRIAGRSGRMILIVLALSPKYKTSRPRKNDNYREIWRAKAKGAVCLIQVIDRTFTPEVLSMEIRHALDSIWIEKGANPGAISNLTALHRSKLLTISFENEKDSLNIHKKQFKRIRTNVTEQKLLNEVNRFCETGRRDNI